MAIYCRESLLPFLEKNVKDKVFTFPCLFAITGSDDGLAIIDLMFNLKCSLGGRMLWQLGTPTVKKFGANSLLNCWMVTMSERHRMIP